MKVRDFVIVAGLFGLVSTALAADAPRTARHLKSCKDLRLTPQDRSACARCVTRSVPHEFSLDRPEAQRCAALPKK